MPPKKPDPQEMEKQLDVFTLVEKTTQKVVDRSTLELWQVCPQQAAQVSSGKVNHFSFAANSGNETHDALSRATTEIIESGGQLSLGNIIESLENELFNARPDVQPDVIKSMKYSVYSWAQFLSTMNPSRIMHYDGGQGALSGQLAWDADRSLRVTSEVDLLYTGPGSPQILYLVDYKSGHKDWTTGDVQDSFQFQLHATLVFENYPECEELHVSIWNTRLNRRTWSCVFYKKNLQQYKARIQNAAAQMWQWEGMPLERVPTWPSIEACSICDARLQCPIQFEPEVVTDRGHIVDRMVALEEILGRMKEIAGWYVDATGKDIITPAGNAYGSDKPKDARKPPKGLYLMGENGVKRKPTRRSGKRSGGKTKPKPKSKAKAGSGQDDSGVVSGTGGGGDQAGDGIGGGNEPLQRVEEGDSQAVSVSEDNARQVDPRQADGDHEGSAGSEEEHGRS